MKNVRRLGQRGFSLIELMIVVAIIGILATVAIPNFQRFQAKARQSEGKGNLSGYYTAQKAAFAEYSLYPGNFAAIGFRPEGQLTYRILGASHADAANVVPANQNDAACVATNAACDANKMGGPINWTEKPSVRDPATAGCPGAKSEGGVSVTHAFTACAAGDIGGRRADGWSIDEGKKFSNDSNGLP